MNCMQIKEAVGYGCSPVKDGVMYLNSPFTLGYDPETIGAYVLEEDDGGVYVTDDGAQIFTALSHGVTLSTRKSQRLNEMLNAYGLSITQQGEVAGRCRQEEVGPFFARYLEASIQLSDEISEMFPSAPKSFEDRVGEILDRQLPRRISRNVAFSGASGHQLVFPFVIDFDTENQKVVQTISTRGQDPRWSTVMQALGKLVDFKEAHETARTFVVLESSAHGDVTRQAKSALVKYASVIEMTEPRDLTRRLDA